jgi:Polyketide cyclase / dehydrase and lipid transport
MKKTNLKLADFWKRLGVVKLGRVIPTSKWGSATVAVFTVAALTVAGTAFSASFLSSYGLGLFVGMPFCLGMVSVLIYGYHERRTFGQSLLVCAYSIVIAGAALLLVAFEGLICLIMAAPLALALSLLGGMVAHVVLRNAWWRQDSDKLICAAILAIPTLIGAEHLSAPEAPLLCVKTAIEVKAAPETVWRHVVSFSDLPSSRDWLFHLGIAYPIRAEIRGQGVGAVRLCEFSTGPFVEPIEVWDEPHLLKFSVTKNPAPMEELTPYREVHPPHLDGFLVSQEGQFLLTKNSDGSTHLEGTTWYQHHLWPAGYWQIWSDFIIHRIHKRVLLHVKNLAEQEDVK